MAQGTIYKYLLAGSWESMSLGVRDVRLPQGAQLLRFSNQGETPAVWALVDPDAPTVPRRLLLAFTGETIDAPADERQWEYVGTADFVGGAIVVHLFDKGEV